MSEQIPTDNEHGGDLEVELSDAPGLSTSGHWPSSAANLAASASPFASRLTRRGRLLRAGGIAGAVLLALVVVLGNFPAARNAAGAWLARWHPAASASAIPAPDVSYDDFYLLPNPPGTAVLLDGSALAAVPYPGDPHPLGLAHGTHTFQWLSNAFPFPPLSCRISVPAAARDTCPVLTPRAVQPAPSANGSDALEYSIIALHYTLAALTPDRGSGLAPDQASALTRAINVALGDVTTTVTLEPGEHYLAGTNAPPEALVSPVQVTLQVRAVPEAVAGPCDAIVPAHPCYFLGQNCGALCSYATTSGGALVTYNGVDPEWIAGMYVRTTLRLTAPDGSLLSQGVLPDGMGVQVMLLGILWDGTNWHVLPLLGHRAALPPSDDFVCDPAFEAIAQGHINYLFYPNASYDVTLAYASGANPSDGCAIRLAGNPHAAEPAIPGDGTALFFERLGVLLAASDAAHYLWPDLPQASAAERVLANQLAAQAG